jgi:hypothetical protein
MILSYSNRFRFFRIFWKNTSQKERRKLQTFSFGRINIQSLLPALNALQNFFILYSLNVQLFYRISLN